MNINPMPADIRIERPFPVEQVVNVNGKTLRVALEWSVIDHFLGAEAANPQAVRTFLSERRLDIARTIKAHLFAQGFPLSGELTLSVEDFRPATAA